MGARTEVEMEDTEIRGRRRLRQRLPLLVGGEAPAVACAAAACAAVAAAVVAAEWRRRAGTLAARCGCCCNERGCGCGGGDELRVVGEDKIGGGG